MAGKAQRSQLNQIYANDFGGSCLWFSACYVDENTTVRFSEIISPNSYR